MQPTIGRIVHYTLSEHDEASILRQYPMHDAAGVRASRNPASAGQTYPALVVRVFDPSANLQVFLDGDVTYWATSRTEGDGPGYWAWPPRV